METKMKLKNIGMVLAAVAASAFVASNLSGCATDVAAQNSTPAVTQLPHSCKGMNSCAGMMPEEHYHRHHHHKHMHRHHHHHKSMHRHHHHKAMHHDDYMEAEPASSMKKEVRKPARARGSNHIGVAGQGQ